MTLQNEKFEELIHEQLARELDPQRGRAAAAFQAQLAADAAAEAAARRAAIAGGSKNRRSWARREVAPRALWLWAGVPSLAAAALAVVVTLHFVNQPATPTPANPGTEIADNRPHMLDGRSPSPNVRGDGGGALASEERIVTPNSSDIRVVNADLIPEIRRPTGSPSVWVEPSDRAFPLTGTPSDRLTPDNQP